MAPNGPGCLDCAQITLPGTAALPPRMNPFTSTAALLALAGLALAMAVLAWWGLRRQRPRPAPAPPQRAGTANDASDRVKRDIEQRVQSLRRARDHAERWVPPAVDAVGPKRKKAAAPPDWADTSFADTTIPDDEPPEPPAPPPRRPAR